ncbi:MAG TPA: alpha-D-glucose phosphate-specific phosphoglucomutase [Bryobacteraceae bacterium]|nr:alpha-D-glucose phosphate-specific phosphoglucomutase [Bryobacteraceae bacterium]
MNTVPTTPFEDQQPGTSGLRKKTRQFSQPRYVENFVQSIFDVIREEVAKDLSEKILVIGGDGRYYNRPAIQTILRIAAANGFGTIMVACGGILSTPAMSAVIRKRSALGGLILSASHNPGGADGDFGIKYNTHNGGPAPEWLTEKIYQRTLKIDRYLTIDHPDLDLDREGTVTLGESKIVIFDPLEDYTSLMESLFDFDALSAYLKSGFRMIFDAMHGSTGPYAHHIFERRLGNEELQIVMRGNPLEDFGGGHPDPNLVYAADFVAKLNTPDGPDFGAACDADGDRNMILGRNFFVSPGDSLAMIAEYAPLCIPGYKGGLVGVARSLPTSTAVDRVAAAAGIKCFETPTGWKYFGNLLDAGLCTLCGEESFGTGSVHVREKDGLWAALCWLSILAYTKKPVWEVAHRHWRKFGRSYFQRHDYERLDLVAAAQMIDELRAKLPSLQMLSGMHVAQADDYSYRDPVDQSVTEHSGLRIVFQDGSRMVCRLSGTGTEGATLRLYLERFQRDVIDEDLGLALSPLSQAAHDLMEIKRRFGLDGPTLVT